MTKERAHTLGEEPAPRESVASPVSQKSPRSSLTSTPRALVSVSPSGCSAWAAAESSLLEVGKQEQDFFDLDDSYLDSRKMDHGQLLEDTTRAKSGMRP